MGKWSLRILYVDPQGTNHVLVAKDTFNSLNTNHLLVAKDAIK